MLTSDAVCGRVTGIAARFNATNIVITGNDVRCHPRSGLSIGPGAPGAVISGNAVSGARIAILVRSSGRIEVDNNLLTGATVFGITARGVSSVVSGVGNTISGTGFRAVDARADARTPQLTDTNTSGWQHHAKSTVLTYLAVPPARPALAEHRGARAALLPVVTAQEAAAAPVPGQHPLAVRWRRSRRAGTGLGQRRVGERRDPFGPVAGRHRPSRPW